MVGLTGVVFYLPQRQGAAGLSSNARWQQSCCFENAVGPEVGLEQDRVFILNAKNLGFEGFLNNKNFASRTSPKYFYNASLFSSCFGALSLWVSRKLGGLRASWFTVRDNV